VSQMKVFRNGTLVTVQMPTADVKELRRRARRAGRTQSAEIRTAVAQYLEAPSKSKTAPRQGGLAQRDAVTLDASSE